jgi:hypothetical protein
MILSIFARLTRFPASRGDTRIPRLPSTLAIFHFLKQTGLTYNYAGVLLMGSSASSVITGYRALADLLVHTKLASLIMKDFQLE